MECNDMQNPDTSLPDEKDEDRFWRKLILPEEDRRLYTSTPWTGGYRWFRSPNVVCLEKYRRLKRRGGSDGRQ
jgi:hypothetical protein